jgi:hypothetical protein
MSQTRREAPQDWCGAVEALRHTLQSLVGEPEKV